MCEKKAREMQASLKAKAPKQGARLLGVERCRYQLFHQGEALAKLGRKAEAIAAYKVVRDDLYFAQTWDPKGWFWSPADAAHPKIDALSGDF